MSTGWAQAEGRPNARTRATRRVRRQRTACASSMLVRQPCMAATPKDRRSSAPLCSSFSVIGELKYAPAHARTGQLVHVALCDRPRAPMAAARVEHWRAAMPAQRASAAHRPGVPPALQSGGRSTCQALVEDVEQRSWARQALHMWCRRESGCRTRVCAQRWPSTRSLPAHCRCEQVGTQHSTAAAAWPRAWRQLAGATVVGTYRP